MTSSVKNGAAQHNAVRIRPTSKLELITPAMAKKWLEDSAAITAADPTRKNRPKSDQDVLMIAAAIDNDEWELNGETIKFADDGFLEDGQHRLEAIIVANRPVESYVVRGLPKDCFDTVDRGRPRSIAQVLRRGGEDNVNVLAAALKMLEAFQTGGMKKPNSRHRAETMKAVLEEHPEIRNSVRLTNGISKIVSQSVAAAAHYLFSRVDEQAAFEFIEKLRQGTQLKPGEPVYMLRERLRANRRQRHRLRAPEIMALMIKAWNMTRTGRWLATLQWRSHGNPPEPFPYEIED